MEGVRKYNKDEILKIIREIKLNNQFVFLHQGHTFLNAEQWNYVESVIDKKLKEKENEI